MNHQPIWNETAKLDDALWARYCGPAEAKCPKDAKSIAWLKGDISEILLKAESIDKTTEDITSMILSHEEGCEILSQVDMPFCRKNALIRKDFGAAFAKERDTGTIASALGYALSTGDLAHLAQLHKKEQYRKRIEDLLTYLNFHYECGRFINGQYGELAAADSRKGGL